MIPAGEWVKSVTHCVFINGKHELTVRPKRMSFSCFGLLKFVSNWASTLCLSLEAELKV